jgi:lyso-ornithine lipid O-acyltransferase
MKLWLRVLPVALFVILTLPAQWLAVRFGWRWQAVLPRLFHKLVARVIGMRVAITGELSKRRPLMLVSNHVSWLDVVVLGALGPVSFIAKSEVAEWPLFGLFARLQRTIFVDRQRRSKTGDVNRSVGERLAAGDVMVLFPEGTTADGTRLLPFRSALLGAAREAAAGDAAVDLQPVSIAYHRRGGLPMTASSRAEEIAWVGDVDLLPNLVGILKGPPIDVTVSFGAVLPYGPKTDRKQAARTIEADVRRMLTAALRS